MCVGSSVVCPSVNVCMVCRVADNLCSSSSKAIWALFTAELTHCATVRLCSVTSRGSHWQRHWGANSLALPQLPGPTLGRRPPSHRAEPLVAVCTCVSSLMALGWSAVLHCHSEILKGRLCQRVLR